jgi:hypothetical protein
VKVAGTKFLLWLSKLPDSPQRSVAVNLTTGALTDRLGVTSYQEVLRSDVLIQQLLSNSNQNAVLPPPADDSVSVLRAMSQTGDRTDQLNSMPPATRAREAAASGFASGTSGDRKMATTTSTSRSRPWKKFGPTVLPFPPMPQISCRR